MQEWIRRASPQDFPRIEEYRAAHRQGQIRDSREPARAVAYLASPKAKRSGAIVEFGVAELARETDAALAEPARAR